MGRSLPPLALCIASLLSWPISVSFAQPTHSLSSRPKSAFFADGAERPAVAPAQLPSQQPTAAPSPQTAPQTTPDAAVPQPLPAIRDLILQVEVNQKAAEAAQKDYTYHVHFEEQDLDKNGRVKKAGSTDSESLTIDGVRIDRVVARNGKPLTPVQAGKESERIDKRVAKATEERARLEDKGKDTDANGDGVLSAARILELGAFSNPRRVILDGRPTIILDYAGNPNAKTHNRFESIVRDLVGTVWIDAQDRVLVQAQGHFLKDFKVGGGLIADVKGDSSFEFHNAKINNEVWLPASVSAQGRIRILLVTGFDGRIHLVTSDYKKFRTSTTIIQSDRVIGPNGLPIAPAPGAPPAASQPGGAQPDAPSRPAGTPPQPQAP